MKLNAKKVFASAEEQPEFIKESHIKHVEMLGITELDTKYRKSNKNVRDVDTVNKHLTDAILAQDDTYYL